MKETIEQFVARGGRVEVGESPEAFRKPGDALRVTIGELSEAAAQTNGRRGAGAGELLALRQDEGSGVMSDGMRINGYAYELTDRLLRWQDAPSAHWENVMTTGHDKRAIEEYGVRKIDDVTCMVFLCADARIRAVSMIAAEARLGGRRLARLGVQPC